MANFHPEAFTLPSIGSLVVALVVGYILFQITKKLITALLLSLFAVGLVVWYFDIFTLDEAKSAATKLEQQAEHGIEGLRKAGDKAPTPP